MANIQLVETSLRDGNQSLWAALGIDTAKTLSIAPALERVGFKAIDFTTSTHMGVAVRYKQENPWERIRLMAEAMPKTPLQFLSTGFRFISWQTASPEFMALAFRTLVNNGIRRFALADPMNDADSNVASARMVKAGGAEHVVAALVFTLSPIHDDAHYVKCAQRLVASPDIDALYIKDPGGLLTPSPRPHSHPLDHGGDGRQTVGVALALHHRSRRACLYGRAAVGRQRRFIALPARLPTESPIRHPNESYPICARSGIELTSMMKHLPRSAATLRGSQRRKVCRQEGHRLLMRVIFNTNCRAA